jgi:LPS-assembly lipoprotein
MTFYSHTRRGFIFGATAIAAMGLSACGFRPLYGTSGVAASPEVMTALAQTRIRPISDRNGQRLRQILNEQLHTNGPAAQPRFDLDIALNKQVIELGVRPDATASRANLIMTATFAVYDGGARIYGDTAQAVVSYNILDDQYATVASSSAAEDRALRQLGDEVKTRLAIYFDRSMKRR